MVAPGDKRCSDQKAALTHKAPHNRADGMLWVKPLAETLNSARHGGNAGMPVLTTSDLTMHTSTVEGLAPQTSNHSPYEGNDCRATVEELSPQPLAQESPNDDLMEFLVDEWSLDSDSPVGNSGDAHRGNEDQ
jgi:hypothetical protein